MKVQFTTAARIAEASMNMSWKKNLFLILSTCILTPVAIVGSVFLVVILAIVEIVVAVAAFAFSLSAVMEYSNVITYPGMTLVCFTAAWLFAKAREQTPRKFFDWLARGGFWYFALITTLLFFFEVSWLVNNYGWLTGIGAVVVTGGCFKLWELVTTKKK